MVISLSSFTPSSLKAVSQFSHKGFFSPPAIPQPWPICLALKLGVQSRHWREAKKSNREEKEKFEILFSNLEKRKRTLKFLSPLSRREREICKKVLHFREEKENGIFYSQVSRGDGEFFTKISNFEKWREIWNSFLKFREEREKFAKKFSFFEKEKRNGYSFLKFREEKENFENEFSKCEKRKRILKTILQM